MTARIHDVDWCTCPDCDRRMMMNKEVMSCIPNNHKVQRDWLCHHCGAQFEQVRIYDKGVVLSDKLTEVF